MSNVTYEASVYSRTVSYTNFKGETKDVELHFALDPIQLMRVFASMPNLKKTKSANPAKKAEDGTLSDEQSLKFLVDLASKAAGFPSDDGESFEPFDEFEESIAGKAFITKLASSDGDREEFAKKVIIEPFKAFVDFAAADEGNSQAEIKQFRDMLASMERIFAVSEKRDESLEDRRARLLAELNSIQGDGQTGE
jgi:hypothetical protein